MMHANYKNNIVIQVGKDTRTGYPCIRYSEESDFIALFPITKMQVEEFLFSHQLSRLHLDQREAMVKKNRNRMKRGKESRMNSSSKYEFPETLPYQMLRRMSLQEIPKTETGKSIFPKQIEQLKRIPLGELNKENRLSLIATNLTIWNDEEELLGHEVSFPTEYSEWFQVLKVWLNGNLPSHDQWDKAMTFFANIPTDSIINAVRNVDLKWTKEVYTILEKLAPSKPDEDDVKNTTSDSDPAYQAEERGLPFMNKGLYELISYTNELYKVASNIRSRKPWIAADGRTALWPILDNRKWRPVLREDVPVVSIRPWYSEPNVEISSEPVRLSSEL